MKKIEAVIDTAALEAVNLHLVEAGIDGRLTVAEVNGIEKLGRYYELQTPNEVPWKPCLRIDLIVSDRQTQSAVNIILRHANLTNSDGGGGHINILPLDVTLEIRGENPQPPSGPQKPRKSRGDELIAG